MDTLVDKGEIDPEEINVSDIQSRKFLHEFHHMMFGNVSSEELDKFEAAYKDKYPGMVNLARAFFGVKKNLN